MGLAKAGPPWSGFIAVTACDSDGVNAYPAWVNPDQIIAVKDWNGTDSGIVEVLTSSNQAFFIKTDSLPQTRKDQHPAERPRPAGGLRSSR